MFRTEAEIVMFIKLVLSLDQGGGGRGGVLGGAQLSVMANFLNLNLSL